MAAQKSGASRSARRKTPARRAASQAMSDVSVIEKPVKTVQGSRTTKYVVTVDNITGLILKVDKIAEAAKEKKAAKPIKETPAMTTAVDPASVTATLAAQPADPAAIVEAYYRGIADYVNALAMIK